MGIGLPELLIVLVMVGGFAAWVVGLVDAARKQRIGWVVAMAITGLLATIAYVIVRPGPRVPAAPAPPA